MRVVWRARARAEFDAIVSYIANDSPAGAIRVSGQIQTMISLLEMWPGLGRAGKSGLRELVVARTSYVVLYRRSPDKVTIVRVVHGKRRR